MTQLADVDHFIAEARNVASPAALHALVSDIAAEMGFDMYTLIHHVDLIPTSADLRDMGDGKLIALTSHPPGVADGGLVALTSYPPDWVETYVARNIVASDPIVLASRRSAVGFRWADVPNLMRMTPAHRDIRSAAVRGGVGEGFTVPAHVPGEANGSCHFAMRNGRPLPEANLLMAQIVGAFAFQAARTMVLNARRRTRKPVQLTSRQIECLVLAARGKTDWEIGQILGISEDSVKYHMKQVRERYDVPTRIQAAFRSLFDGQIELSDVVG